MIFQQNSSLFQLKFLRISQIGMTFQIPRNNLNLENFIEIVLEILGCKVWFIMVLVPVPLRVQTGTRHGHLEPAPTWHPAPHTGTRHFWCRLTLTGTSTWHPPAPGTFGAG